MQAYRLHPLLQLLPLLLLQLGARWARAGAPRCTYTLVLPPQQLTGAVCWSGPAAARRAPAAANTSEVAALRVRLDLHEALLRELQRRAAAESSEAGQVLTLRQENHGLSARLGQLRAQLRHEPGAEPVAKAEPTVGAKPITKEDPDEGAEPEAGAESEAGAEPGAELALLQQRVLNASAEAQRAAAGLHQLDSKFRELAQLVRQQSVLIARLERLCPGGSGGGAGGQQQVTPKPPLAHEHQH